VKKHVFKILILLKKGSGKVDKKACKCGQEFRTFFYAFEVFWRRRQVAFSSVWGLIFFCCDDLPLANTRETITTGEALTE
jgi:hypothetical protein